MAQVSGTVDTVVFDIGGVLVDWSRNYLYDRVIADTDRRQFFLESVCTGEWNAAQDAGRSWAEAEAEAIARHPDFAVEIRLFRDRWHETIKDALWDTVAILEGLDARGVPLYAITNYAVDTYDETIARFAFLKRFRGVVVSGHLGFVKPDPRIYEHLLATYALAPERCVFIDDSLKNVEGARAAGMHGIHFSSAPALRHALAPLLKAGQTCSDLDSENDTTIG